MTSLSSALVLASIACVPIALAQEAAPAPTPVPAPAPAQAAEAPATALPAPAAEAPPAEADAAGLEEVVVTARRREESAQSVPIAVSVLDSKALEEHHVESLDSLQYLVPSLTVSVSNGERGSANYGLRGIVPTETIYGQDPTVAVYFSEVALSPSQGNNLDIYDLASVQVLKGPQGTLFGRNTTGGAVLFTPRLPGSSFGGDVMVGYGNYNKRETEFGVDLPFASMFKVRVSGHTIDQQGYQTNAAAQVYDFSSNSYQANPLYGSHIGGENLESFRLTSVANLTDELVNETVLTWSYDKTGAMQGILTAVNRNNGAIQAFYGGTSASSPNLEAALLQQQGRSVYDVATNFDPYENTKVVGFFNTTTYTFNDNLKLKNILGYRASTVAQAYNLASVAIPNVLTAAPQSQEMKHESDELQLQGNSFGGRFEWASGLYFYHETGFQDYPGDIYSPFIDANPEGGNPFTQLTTVNDSSESIFGQGTFRFTPEWGLTGGVRWTHDTKRMTISNYYPNYCPMQDADGNALPLDHCERAVSKSFSQPTATLSLDWRFHEGMLAYVTSRLGYRSGGFNARAEQSVEFQPFKQETVKDIEVGTKDDWSFGGWKFRTNLDVYHQWYDDIQRTVGKNSGETTPASVVVNAATAEVTGAEADLTVSPFRPLQLNLNYAYVLPTYDRWNDADAGGDLHTTPFFNTPRHSASATAIYTLQFDKAGRLALSSTFSVRSGVYLDSLDTSAKIAAALQDAASQNTNLLPTLRQAGYGLLDFNATWSGVMGTGLEATAFVKNVTDRAIANGGLFLYEAVGISTKTYDQPRTYGMDLRYSF